MRIKVNHPDPEIAEHIMDWLYKEHQVMGNEDGLRDEPIINLISMSGFWDLEIYLSDIFDDNIELKRNLKFIEY